jgi:hypothetical protein
MEVERSNDTQDWISVYRTNGAGNSLEETTYEGIDFNVPKVPLYYRLKQVDYDGDIEFYNITYVAPRSENFGDMLDLMIYPNPSNSSSVIHIELIGSMNQQAQIVVHNIYGDILHSETLLPENQLQFIDLSLDHPIPSGYYVVSAKSIVGTIHTTLLVR